jgi:mRNA interferase RelE/StbE
MDSYDIQWKKSAEKDVRAIDVRQIPRVIRAVEALSTNPFPTPSKKLRYTDHIYRLRVGDYRVVYEVCTKTNVITIYHIRHRKNAYR